MGHSERAASKARLDDNRTFTGRRQPSQQPTKGAHGMALEERWSHYTGQHAHHESWRTHLGHVQFGMELRFRRFVHVGKMPYPVHPGRLLVLRRAVLRLQAGRRLRSKHLRALPPRLPVSLLRRPQRAASVRQVADLRHGVSRGCRWGSLVAAGATAAGAIQGSQAQQPGVASLRAP